LVWHIKTTHSESVSKRDDETLKKMVRSGVKKAESHHLTSVEDTKAFISMMFEVAPNFDEQAEIKAVLDDEKVSPAERIEKLKLLLVSEKVREEAKNNYDEKAWFPERKKTPSTKTKSSRAKRLNTKKIK
jgi:hypothetical protein